MPNPSTYPYRRFPTIQVGAADHAARGTDAVKQELHALCAGSSKTVVTVECYPGTDQAEILALFPHAELIIHADDLAIQPAELDAKIEHELTDDPVFGIMTTWQMKNFYPEEALCAARGKIDAVTDGLVLVYGVGASLVERADITIYADITRWEIQLRFRKGQDNWHTAMHDLPQRAKYKRGYFAEWRWGDRIKDKLLPVFDYYLDTTSAGNPAIVPGTAYRDALSKAAAQPFRMVPYFDPGVWGGDWMKTHFDLPENGSNYAWSFDGVPEENSLLLDFGSCVVETPALNLVYGQHQIAVKVAEFRHKAVLDVAGIVLQIQHPAISCVQLEMVGGKLHAVGAEPIFEMLAAFGVFVDIELRRSLFPCLEKVAENMQALVHRQFGCHRGKLRQVCYKVGPHAGKVTAGFVCIAFYHAHGQVAFPHNAVAGAGDLRGQHLVELVAVFVQTIILVGQQDTALERGLVDAAIVNRDFSRCAGIESVQQFRIINEHTGFVLFAGDGVVNVSERPCFGILVADLENPIRKDAADGDGILYTARNTELFAFHLLRF